MRPINVYQFEYFDRRVGRFRISSDFATERAIKEIHATILRETCRCVGENQIGRAGYLVNQAFDS